MRIIFTLGISLIINIAYSRKENSQEINIRTMCTLRPVKEIALKIVIKDINDKAPVSGATVSIFKTFKKDSLHFAANDSGIVVAKFPVTEDSYTVRITAVGYQDTLFMLNRNGIYDVFLKRNIIEMTQVVLAQYVQYRIRCYQLCGGVQIKQEKDVDDSVSYQNHFSDNYLKLFPNPAMKRGIINMVFNSLTSDKVLLRVCSLDGKIVHSAFFTTNVGTNRYQVQANNRWPAGTYIFQLLYANGGVAASGKVIIQ